MPELRGQINEDVEPRFICLLAEDDVLARVPFSVAPMNEPGLGDGAKDLRPDEQPRRSHGMNLEQPLLGKSCQIDGLVEAILRTMRESNRREGLRTAQIEGAYDGLLMLEQAQEKIAGVDMVVVKEQDPFRTFF